MTLSLLDLPHAWRAGDRVALTSVCSAHPVVIEAALRDARDRGRPALIEATCNQVNQDGGYTGMTPADFRAFVERVAREADCGEVEIILGGDHLGPNPWKDLPAEDAMAKAVSMIEAYARAGFTKLHLDTSMGCAGEPVALDDATTAARAARLARAAEAAATGPRPVYVIGTEVPVPGGALEELDHLQVTDSAAVRETHAVHRAAFEEAGLAGVFDRVIALVVQPGVEFGHSDVVHYDPEKATGLTAVLSELPGIVFEAHSTDYQTPRNLAALAEGGFCIRKVGPWLTFALREALYGLDAIADVLDGRVPSGGLMAAMEGVMLERPGHWAKYYSADPGRSRLQRHFSLSDRIRYYWPTEAAEAAVTGLLDRLGEREIPGPLARQYLPHVHRADLALTAKAALVGAVREVLRHYAAD